MVLKGVTTATYTGQMTTTFEDTNGYDDAQDACVAEFGGNAHVCTTHELGLVSQSEGMRALSTHVCILFLLLLVIISSFFLTLQYCRMA